MKTIEVKNLSKTYGETKAIEDLNFSVNTGEIVGFLGPNGAGKTTTMRILAGYLPATSGTVKIAGYDIHHNSMQVRRRIGYLPENPPLYPDMSVENFLHFVAKIKGVKGKERSRKVISAMKRCQIEKQGSTVIRKLSKGYRQRVGIAQAIVHDPPAIILDEPTVGLDPRQIIEVRNLIKSLAGEHTVVLSTHILPEVSMTCDRVTIIDRGRVVVNKNTQDLMAQISNSYSYELEIGGDVQQIVPLLESIPGVIEIERLIKPDNNGDRTSLEITCTKNREPGALIAYTISQENFKLYEMRRIRPNLEDIFLKLTTEENS